MTKTKPTVLILSKGYPPDARYSLRTIKHCAYLPATGWAVCVVSTGLPWNRKNRMAGEHVTRVPALPSPSETLRSLRSLLKPLARSGVSGAGAGVGEAARVPSGPPHPLKNFLRWFDVPDRMAWWIPGAVMAGVWRARRSRVSAVYASGPPFSVCVAGVVLGRLIRRPVVVDFRDAWTLDPGDPFGSIGGSYRAGPSPRREKFLARLERWVLRNAQHVVFTSETTSEVYLKDFPKLADKSSVIYNGADPADFRAETARTDHPTFGHVGTIYPHQVEQVGQFLRAFRIGLEDGSIPVTAEVAFVGAFAGTEHLVKRLILECRLESHVRLIGLVAHAEAVQWMQRVWKLLLFTGDNELIRSLKLAEYLAAGPGVLVIADRATETTRAAERHGATVCSAHDARAVAHALTATRAANEVDDRRAEVLGDGSPLSRETNSRELAMILNHLTDGT